MDAESSRGWSHWFLGSRNFPSLDWGIPISRRHVVRHQGRQGASLVAPMVKNLPAVAETQVQSLGQEDPLEKGMATNSSILAWRIPWTEELGKLQSMGLQSWTRLSN